MTTTTRSRHEIGTVTERRRDWTVLAIVEVVLAIAAVVSDLLIPTIVLLALAAISLAFRREELGTLGFRRPGNARRMAAEVLGFTAAWSMLQLGLIMPALSHLTGSRQDLSDFEGLRGDVGLFVGLLVLSWTLAALGEELVYRGYIQTRVRDVLGDGATGIVVAIVLSSVLFGLAHTEQGLVGVVVTFLDALFFSAMRLRYRDNLWASVLAHGFNNTMGLIAFFLVGPIYGLW